MGIKITTEIFIEESNIKHNNFYSYDKTEYLKAHAEVVITCPVHGDFKQTPTSHKSGSGCPECGRKKANKNRKIWTEISFREKVSKLHPSLDFTKTVYVNPTTKVLYSCKAHGERKAYPYNLLKGHSCKQCDRSKNRISKEDWLKRFSECGHKNITYEKIPEYFKAEEKITFNCIYHGEFKQTPIHHLRSSCSCPKCGRGSIKKHNQENPTGWSYTNWQEAGERSKNFDSFKVYIIRCWDENEEFYKIGKTFLKLSKRFDSPKSMPYQWEVVNYYSFSSSKKASSVERYLQNIHKMYKYNPFILFGGYSECFSKINPMYSSDF